MLELFFAAFLSLNTYANAIQVSSETSMQEDTTNHQTATSSSPAEKSSYFSRSRQNLSRVLDHSVFQRFQDYVVDNFREGEIGESQAFFVRLVKPFSENADGYCFVFLGTSTLKEKPRVCSHAE